MTIEQMENCARDAKDKELQLHTEFLKAEEAATNARIRWGQAYSEFKRLEMELAAEKEVQRRMALAKLEQNP